VKYITEIPEIDLSPLSNQNKADMEYVAEQIKLAYTQVGFAYLINHNISSSLIEEAFSEAEKFHSLPLEEKLKIKQNDCFRGYVPINASILKVSTLGQAAKPNQLDAFVMAFDPDVSHPQYKPGVYLAGQNQWPILQPSLQNVLCQYRDEMLKLAKTLLNVFSIALGASPGELDHLFSPPTFFLRLQHYPVQSPDVLDEEYGLAPHTDYGFFTLLSQKNVEGLEVQTTEGRWIAVPYKLNTFILNSGDMLRRMSNDTFLSTPHRVRNLSGVDRYSIPFFFDPNMYKEIKVLESCSSAENPAKYPPIKYGEYLMDRIQGNYNLGKREL
jgi:isopenicillin N synthase-like dioxygenase